ncbi:MAG: DUF4160 domain-containing protein [Terriglobia bacterium]
MELLIHGSGSIFIRGWRRHRLYVGEYEISVEIESGTIHGEFPARAQRLVLEWANLHKQELIENWQLARQGQPLKRVAPLE